MAGRPRKPTAQHTLDGTARADRMNTREPAFALGAPDKPACVSARVEASREWDRIVPILVGQRTLTVADLAVLVAYCATFADLVDVETVKASPDYSPLLVDLVIDGAGQEHRRVRANPIVASGIKSSHENRQAAMQLGLTPAARAKVSSAPAPTMSAFEAFAAKRRSG